MIRKSIVVSALIVVFLLFSSCTKLKPSFIDITGKWIGTMLVTNETDELEIGFYITDQNNGDFFGAFIAYEFYATTNHEDIFQPLGFGSGYDITGEIDEENNVVISIYEKRFEEESEGKISELFIEIIFAGAVDGDTMSGSFELTWISKEDGESVDKLSVEGAWVASRDSSF